MTARRSLVLMAIGAAASVVVAGCSGTINENAVESAIEQNNPGLDADVQDGGAGITATDEDGNDIGVGTSANVPEGFPSAVPLPTGNLTVSAKSPDGQFTLQYQVEASAEEAASTYRSQLEGAGFTIDSTASVSGVGGFEATGQGYSVAVVSIGAGGTTSLSLSVQPE